MSNEIFFYFAQHPATVLSTLVLLKLPSKTNTTLLDVFIIFWIRDEQKFNGKTVSQKDITQFNQSISILTINETYTYDLWRKDRWVKCEKKITMIIFLVFVLLFIVKFIFFILLSLCLRSSSTSYFTCVWYWVVLRTFTCMCKHVLVFYVGYILKFPQTHINKGKIWKYSLE